MGPARTMTPLATATTRATMRNCLAGARTPRHAAVASAHAVPGGTALLRGRVTILAGDGPGADAPRPPRPLVPEPALAAIRTPSTRNGSVFPCQLGLAGVAAARRSRRPARANGQILPRPSGAAHGTVGRPRPTARTLAGTRAAVTTSEITISVVLVAAARGAGARTAANSLAAATAAATRRMGTTSAAGATAATPAAI